MTTAFHRLGRSLILSAALAGLSLTGVAQTDSVVAPAKRQESIDLAAKLLAAREITVVAKNPFSPEAFSEVVGAMGRSATSDTSGEAAVQATGPRNDRDLLRAIGAGLKPSGFFVLGGQPTLVFGQKRVKAGGTLTITFEGAEHTLEITAISPPHFTLRLNREEFTRTIK
jgi:hypothetical protein